MSRIILGKILFGLLVFWHGAIGFHRLEAPKVQANGVFKPTPFTGYLKKSGVQSIQSKDDRFQVQYQYNPGGEISSLQLISGPTNLYQLKNLGRGTVQLSNSGYVVIARVHPVLEMPEKFEFYSPQGQLILSHSTLRPQVAHFSQKGNIFGISGKDHLEVINLETEEIRKYKKGRKFDISDEGKYVSVSYEKGVSFYSNGKLIKEVRTDITYNRDLKIGPQNQYLAAAGKNTVLIYSLPSMNLVHRDIMSKHRSIRNLVFGTSSLWAGIKEEKDNVRKGILKTYDLSNNQVPSTESIQSEEPVKRSGLDVAKFKSQASQSPRAKEYPPIPYPVAPQEGPNRSWNAYEGLNSSGDGVINNQGMPYLHQGLDIETEIAEPVYSVNIGTVKYHGDLGGSGAKYWRVAISPEDISGPSTGWLYAHLIESSINYAVGDVVPELGLHLGDVVEWFDIIKGHLHFVEISDHGDIWSYDDDEWGITHNPHLSLSPSWDSTPPVIVPSIPGKSKFAYYPNGNAYDDTQNDYLDPDSAAGGLKGDIDIAVTNHDYVYFEHFKQPAFILYYWIKGVDPTNSSYNKLVVDTTLAQVRNHAYSTYDGYKPASQILYKVDNVFVVGGWFSPERNFTQVLTNNNGDSLLTIGEEDSTLHTEDFYDGWYQIYVRAEDEAGNAVVDSERVYFNNGNMDNNASNVPGSEPTPDFRIIKSPSPSGAIRFEYFVTKPGKWSIQVTDLTGKVMKQWENQYSVIKNTTIHWDTVYPSQKINHGLYFVTLKGPGVSTTQTLIF